MSSINFCDYVFQKELERMEAIVLSGMDFLGVFDLELSMPCLVYSQRKRVDFLFSKLNPEE
jgi:hypothetical protein